MNRDWL